MNKPTRRQHIHVVFDYPPIPTRKFDWSAYFDDYEPPQRIGRGASPAEALCDLLYDDECEHMVVDGDFCHICNAAYKSARLENGEEDK